MNCRHSSTPNPRRTWAWLKTGLLGAALALFGSAQAQVTTNSSSGLNPTYPDLASAITALNGATITAPVVITLDPANPQTSPAGGYSITATGTAANTILIAGSNNTITAPTTHTVGALNDAIFKIIGGDYITIQNFTMNENGANIVTTAASNNMTEWGVALLYATTTNGAQFCTIQNNTIALNRTYQNTFGIYANATHSATAPTTSASATTTAGGNSGLTVRANNISNVNLGIVVVGPTAAADANTGVTIGGATAPDGNVLTNFGTTGTFSSYANVSGTGNGILIRNSNGFNVSYNSITSSVGGVTAGTLNGIQQAASSNTPTGTFTNTFSFNTINLQTGVSAAVNGINIPSGSATTTSVENITNNNFTALTSTVANSSTISGIITASTHFTTNVNSNTFTNIVTSTTGGFTFISNSFSMPASGTSTCTGNSIVGTFSKTGAGGTVTCITSGASSPNGSTETVTNNNFSNITVTGATAITGINNNNGSGSSPTKTFTGNTLSNWTGGTSGITGITIGYVGAPATSVSSNTITNLTGQSTITAINIGSTVNLANPLNIASNTISNLSSTGTGGTVTGITCSNTSTTININNNNVNTLSSTATSVIGIAATGSTANNVFKNLIYDLSSTNTGATINGINLTAGTVTGSCTNNMVRLGTNTATGCAINGINETGGSNNVYHNSVYIGGSPTTGTANSFAFNSTVTTNTRNFIDNIFFNARSNSGSTGKHYAIRVGGTAALPAGLTSNYNILRASGSGGFTGLFNGIDQASIGAWRTATGHDNNSRDEDPAYQAPTASTPDLHIDPSVQSSAEAMGTLIASVTDDFDGQTRSGLTPVDIGADAGNFTQLALCSASNPGTIGGTSPACVGASNTLTLSGGSVGLGLTYQWAYGNPGGPYTNNLGTAATQSTSGIPAGTWGVIVTATCANCGPCSTPSAEFALTINPLPTASAGSNSPVCAGQPLNLTGTSNGTSFSWTGPLSFTSSSQSPQVSATATTGMAGTYVFTATLNGCTSAPSNTVVVINPSPSAITVTPPAPTICSGSSVVLTASGGNGFGSTTFGTQATQNTAGINNATDYPAPYQMYWGGQRMQTLVLASELSAAGYAAGSTINSIAFPVVSFGASYVNNQSFQVSMGHTALSALTSTFVNGLTVVAPATTFAATVGYNNVHTFSTPFTWNGTSNVIIETTFSNNFAGTAAYNVVQYNSPTAFAATAVYRADSQTPATVAAATTASYAVYNSRPDFKLVGTSVPGSFVWNASPDLNTTSGPVVTATPPATNTYTVSSTSGGCTTSQSVTVTIGSGAPPSVVISAGGPTTFCTGGSVLLSSNVTDGCPAFTYVWSDGVNTVGTNSPTYSATASGTYSVTITDAGSQVASSNTITVTVNPIPTATASSNSPVCAGSPLNLTGTSNGATFSWTGPNSFASTDQNPVVSASATAAMAGTYAFTATLNGCTSPVSNTIVVVNPSPSITSTTATPSTICSGDNSQLDVVATTGTAFMSVVPVAYAPVAGSGTAITTWTAGGDATNDDGFSAPVTLPFTFTLNGTGYTQVWVSPNGYLTFLNPSAVTALQARTSSNMTTSTVPNGVVALTFADMIASAGTVSTFSTGGPGNQVFVLDYTNVPFYNGTGSVTGQIQLYENGNVIEVHAGTVNHGTNTSVNALGVENGAGSARVFAPGRDPVTLWNVTVSEAWRFAPSTNTYSWSPATFLSSTTISNPMANAVTATTPYTVTVTNSLNCSAQGTATVTVAVTDDGDPCTLDACVGGVVSHTFQDADSDGICDANDPCPNLANLQNGDPCDDGNACTTGDIVSGCVCAGTFQDTDSDGICDANDNCPTVPGVQGDACTDGDACTTGDVLNASCVCAGTFQDTDSDGICDANDDCPTVPGEQGDPCTDGNVCTINDVITASCVCAGTFQDTDADGICDANDNCPLLFGQQGDACDDGNPNTTLDVITPGCVCAGQAVDCLGVPSGTDLPGTPCNDANVCTINDTWSNACVCVGTFQDTDLDGICDANDNCPTVPGVQGDACTDGDACTTGDVINASCVCAGTFQDTDLDGICDANDNCPTVPGVQGDACTDGNVCTINDVLNASCVCVGTFQDTDSDGICDANDNCPNLSGQQGDACNDGNACTIGDVITAGCVCAGTFQDTDSDGICDANDNCPTVPGVQGDACTDGDACTINDVLNASCVCAGTFQDTDSDGICDANDNCPTLAGQQGDACNDGNVCTISDVITASCVCAGTPDNTDTDGDGTPDCSDNCPAVAGQQGSPCDDGDVNTSGDVLDANCECHGSICTQNATHLTFVTDADGEQISWSIVDQITTTAVCEGTGLPDNSTITVDCCLPDGCYDLIVTDMFGDGIHPGGFVLRDGSGRRIIDNDANGPTFSSVSKSALGFCLPLSTDGLVAASCDIENATLSTVLHAEPNAVVTAFWTPSNTSQQGYYGYQYWVTNPHGGYSRRILLTLGAPGSGAPPGTPANLKPTYFALSSINQSAPFLPRDILLNVRVRAYINGVYGLFGPACRLKVPYPPCTTTQLTTTATPVVSCGATGLSLSSTIYADAVTGGTHYQFEFTKPGYTRRITQTVRSTALSFVTSPLQNNNCYQVRVRVSIDGAQTYCPFGPYCTVTIGSAVCAPPGMELDPSDDVLTNADAHLTLWPNPNDGSQVRLSLLGFSPEVGTVAMDVTDVFGKLVATRTIPVQDGQLMTTIDFENTLAPGLYLVNLTAGENRYTERLVIQR